MRPKEDLGNGELVMCSQMDLDRYLIEHYNLEKIEQFKYLVIYRVTGRKVM